MIFLPIDNPEDAWYIIILNRTFVRFDFGGDFTGGFVSYTSFDYDTTSIVPVIASFDAGGHIRPLYVRLGRSSYRIAECFVSSRYSGVTEFRCRIADGESLKPLQLSYYSREAMWTVPFAQPEAEG